jgi:FkbM family methyltransferase
MRLSERFTKPEYLYRPQQALRRLAHAVLPEPERTEVMLPWGLKIRVSPREAIGRAIWQLGVYDLSLSEAVWRLLDRGETAIDVGANIGYVTGLMAVRVGLGGRVMSFEPHPGIFEELRANVESWRGEAIAPITTFQLALSSEDARAFLEGPASQNMGTARVVFSESGTNDGLNLLKIRTVRLDDVCGEDDIGLVKVDVEGHELETLSGARQLLDRHAVRDIVYEDHSSSFTSPSALMMTKLGYTIFALNRGRARPNLLPSGVHIPSVCFLPQNFLATRRPERAIERFRDSGWQVLRPATYRRPKAL